MLFNSSLFIFVFLPVCCLLFYLIRKFSEQGTLIWLLICSLFFYGWWEPKYLILLVGSILVNYLLGRYLSGENVVRTPIMALGIILNLLSIGIYKYLDFFIENTNLVLDTTYTLRHLILPLGISFFTFQQISYLVDVWRDGKSAEKNLIAYASFVTFFPQLIAGPIVRHDQLIPQLKSRLGQTSLLNNLGLGFSVFTVGLFKKVIIADRLAVNANAVFQSALDTDALPLDMLTAWSGTLAYTMQLYFDFSGYSDMAIGLAQMLGIVLPLNFLSPYRSKSIIEFWRRWHITLSTFLRDYVYIPLGGNRKGQIRRYVNLMATMLIGGLWHGAGWTFIAWGGLHGFYLIVNNAYAYLRKRLFFLPSNPNVVTRFISWLLTFLAVAIGWIFFRADSFEQGIVVLRQMFDTSQLLLPETWTDPAAYNWYWIFGASLWAIFLPNVYELFEKNRPSLGLDRPFERDRTLPIRWSPSVLWAVIISYLFLTCVRALVVNQETIFLYFNF